MARIVRTDRELEMQRVDAALRAAGHELVLLPDGGSEDKLSAAGERLFAAKTSRSPALLNHLICPDQY